MGILSNRLATLKLSWLLLYVAGFALLFLQFPLKDALPGNNDTWLVGVAVPKILSAQIAAWFEGDAAHLPLFPVTEPLAYGESALGCSLLAALLQGTGLKLVWAYYCFIVTLYASSAFAVALFVSNYVEEAAVCLLGGWFFSGSTFALANIDSPHTVLWALPVLAGYFLERHFQSGNRRALFVAAALAGLQAYFSAYLFLFGVVSLLLQVANELIRGRAAGGRNMAWRDWGLAALLSAGLAAPFFLFYVGQLRSQELSDPWEKPIFLAEIHSLDPVDWFRPLPNALTPVSVRPIQTRDIGELSRRLHTQGLLRRSEPLSERARLAFGKPPAPEQTMWFVTTRRSAQVGFLALSLACVGWFSRRRGRGLGLALVGVGGVLALGPVMTVGDALWPTPMYPLYRWVEAVGRFRVPSRAFFISVLGLVLLQSLGLAELRRRLAAKPWWRRGATALVFVLWGAEHVPVKLPAFAGTRFEAPSAVLQIPKGERVVVLNLPSSIGGALAGDDTDLFAWSREAMFMSWHASLGIATVNGTNGYLPRSRLDVEEWSRALPDAAAFRALSRLGVTHIAYHPRLGLPWEPDLLPALQAAPELRLLRQGKDGWLFGLRPE